MQQEMRGRLSGLNISPQPSGVSYRFSL